MDFFQDIPTTDELLGYMAGAVRDCIGSTGSLELEADAILLFDEFGGEAGFYLDRSAYVEMNLARRMSELLHAISMTARDQSVAELALINVAAFAEGCSLIEVRAA